MIVESFPVEGSPQRPDASVPDREEIHLKLLASLRAAGDGGELGVVRRIATWIDSPRVLAEIAAHPSWFADFGIKEAFVLNEHTPEDLRSRCAQAVGVLDLLRELDGPGLAEREREEIRDQTRSLIRALPAEDRDQVRRRARELSASREAPGEGDAPPRAEVEPPADLGEEPALSEARPERGELPGLGAGSRPAAPFTRFSPKEIRPEEGRSVALSVLPLERKVALARTTRDLAVLQVLSLETADEALPPPLN